MSTDRKLPRSAMRIGRIKKGLDTITICEGKEDGMEQLMQIVVKGDNRHHAESVKNLNTGDPKAGRKEDWYEEEK